jgi:hypothetical protein
MGRVRVVDTDKSYEDALAQRRTFYGSVKGKRTNLKAQWPEEIVHIGRCVAQIYNSNKALSKGKYEIYKHVAEAGQDLFINPQNTKLFDRSGKRLVFICEHEMGSLQRPSNNKSTYVLGCRMYDIESEMPKYVSELAEDKGMQAVLHDGEYYEIRIPKATWASCKHPQTGETFLILYSKEGIHFIVTGSELDITEHGIVG